MLHELVELVHVYVHKELGSEIAERQPDALPRRMKAPDDPREEPDDILVGNISLENVEQNSVVYRGKELADVALQDPRGLRPIFGYLLTKGLEPLHGPMGALSEAT